MNLDNAIADVYLEKSGTYYVKFSLLDIGMYISGITVKKSPKFRGWWVQMPYYKDPRTGNSKRYIEFDQESPAREKIELLCIKVVENKANDTTAPNS